MKQSIRITSRVNKRLYADAIPGHFATNHSHINYYIDMSEIKHSMAMSREAARSIAYQFSSTSIDTLLCMEGTEYIGAYLAGELSSVGMGNVNSGKDIYLVEPDSNVNGQFVFSDNLRHMIEHRNVLVLVNSGIHRSDLLAGEGVRRVLRRPRLRLCGAVLQYQRAERQKGRQPVLRRGFSALPELCARQSLPGLCRRHSAGCNRHPERVQ